MHVQLELLHDQLQTELKKFRNNGNKAAGTRARILAQKLKTLCQDIRLDIQSTKKGA